MKITNEEGELKPVTGFRNQFGYMSGVLRGRPGRNLKTFGVTV
jgi:hypothetical protein